MSLGAHIEALHILVKLVDVENIVVVIVCRALVTATTTKREVALAIVIEEDSRVEAPTDAIAVRKTATPVVNELLTARNRVRPGAGNAVGANKANTATTAIGEHNVKSVIIGIHGNTGSPDIADTVDLTGIIDNAEVGPVLHILRAETVEGLDVVTIGVCHSRVVRVGDDVEVGIIGSGTRVRQVVVARNRIIGKGCRGKNAHGSQSDLSHTISLHRHIPVHKKPYCYLLKKNIYENSLF